MPDSPHSIPNPNAASPGMRRQFEIYQLGLAGKKLSVPIPLARLEKKAAEVLSPQAYDYVAGSASGERTARANLAAFDRWRIVPRMLRDVSQRDLTVELFGQTLPAPVLLGPVGVQNIIHPDAEVAVGRAAASLGVPFVLSTVSSRPIEEVAQTLWPEPRAGSNSTGAKITNSPPACCGARKSQATPPSSSPSTPPCWDGANATSSIPTFHFFLATDSPTTSPIPSSARVSRNRRPLIPPLRFACGGRCSRTPLSPGPISAGSAAKQSCRSC